MRLILISLDAVSAADAEFLLSLPNLGGLAAEGVFCDRVQTVYPALTYPVHASIVTGCYPERHGIGHNIKFEPDKPAQERPWYWDAGEIRVETLHSVAAEAGREVASVLWPVTGHHRGITYNFPEVLALRGESQVLKMLRYGSAWWILRNEILYGRTRPDIRQPHLDRYAVLLCEKLIAKQYYPGVGSGRRGDIEPSAKDKKRHMPDLLTLHLTDCDAERHAHGVDSTEARAALHRLDQAVGRLLTALNQVDALKGTVVAVVSDHGQEDVTSTLPLDEWLCEKGAPARAQTLGLGAYIHCGRGASRLVYDLLVDNMEELGLSRVYSKEELRSMHAMEGIKLAVESGPGVEIVDRSSDSPHKATHGFGPLHPGSQCLLWLSGLPFRKGARLEKARIIDVAPTLAQAVGLTLPQAQGKVLWDAFTD